MKLTEDGVGEGYIEREVIEGKPSLFIVDIVGPTMMLTLLLYFASFTVNMTMH